jgi:RHS repeat-associated protein
MRKTMTTSSGTVTFHYDENNNVDYETDENNQVIASYTFEGDHPVSMTRGGKTYYYQLNGHGDVVALTDSTGAKVATYEYGPYGDLVKKTGSVENPYLYAGYRYDEETGFYYLQSRYYDPEIGRFLTRDTFDGDENVPLSQNRYAYVHNNPALFIDKDGNYRQIALGINTKVIYKRYIPQSLIDSAFEITGVADLGTNYWAKGQIKQILGKILRHAFVPIAFLWVYSRFTGKKGVTLFLLRCTFRIWFHPYTRYVGMIRPGKV